MILTASVYARAADDLGGLRVLIMRYWPRGVRRERVDVWLRDAAPSVELLRAYTRAELAWSDFEAAYAAEMRQRPAVLAELRRLEHEHHTITLLCRERDEHCHRYTLQRLLLTSAEDGDAAGGEGG